VRRIDAPATGVHMSLGEQATKRSYASRSFILSSGSSGSLDRPRNRCVHSLHEEFAHDSSQSGRFRNNREPSNRGPLSHAGPRRGIDGHAPRGPAKARRIEKRRSYRAPKDDPEDRFHRRPDQRRPEPIRVSHRAGHGGQHHGRRSALSNFNNGSPFNIQGLGTTVEDLHATPGSKPTRIAQDSRLTGPSELVTATTDDFAWVSAFTANGLPIVGDTASGGVVDDLTGNGLQQPWGQTFSGTKDIRGVAAFYVSNSTDGSITRINITKKAAFTYDKIATGFSVNHGVPGTVLAPAGLTYDARADVLYIVDSNMNRLVAFLHPGNVPVGGIIVNPYGGFGGVSGSSARVVYAGRPLNAPISAALLYNGDVVVGNTANNRLIEITPTGSAVGNKLLDNGAVGALFGIAASGSSIANQKIYFNDDNMNTVEVLQQ
jgi:hypothetical protein